MSAQTRYGYSTPKGGAGGIVDIAPYAIDTLLNEEENGVMKHGMGVVQGSIPGANAKKPADGATAAKFEGVVVNNRTTELDFDGDLSIKKGAALGIMRYGRIYARLVKDVTPAYGEPVYLVTNGDDAGLFTNVASGNIAIKARFLGTVDTTCAIAQIELFNQAQV